MLIVVMIILIMLFTLIILIITTSCHQWHLQDKMLTDDTGRPVPLDAAGGPRLGAQGSGSSASPPVLPDPPSAPQALTQSSVYLTASDVEARRASDSGRPKS
jgi:hypothetical protein